MLGPFATASRRHIAIHQVSHTASHTACTSMATTTTTTTTTTTRDRGNRYGPMEWAQLLLLYYQQFRGFFSPRGDDTLHRLGEIYWSTGVIALHANF